MRMFSPCLMVLSCLALAACEQKNGEGATGASAPEAASAPETARPLPEGDVAGATNDADDGAPDLRPPPLTPEAERGVKGARNVLLSFARAIELGDYGQAWAMLGPADREKWTKAAFAAIFSDLDDIVVAMPDGSMEGAAGSSYYSAPISVTGKDAEGRPVRIEGEAILRRVNDIEGASPEQLRWHFETVTLSATH
ncbi:hypothetical protein [Sphingobium sp. SYK-6]|uniref:hypothetical protein n=1 Tax=Sphingobium sp. (strain NBRC 103272 / SYK-6) TaxID=627192 RepID=UPI0013140EC8|nr:hypothetical protein [Sphingobium sp. SYK-6]